jgi:hypothetical protein
MTGVPFSDSPPTAALATVRDMAPEPPELSGDDAVRAVHGQPTSGPLEGGTA